MRFALRVRTALLAACVVAVAACGDRAAPAPPKAALTAIARQPPLPGLRIRPLTDRTFERNGARRERGRYLAEGILQCALCHSDRDWGQPGAPPVQSRTMAGHVWNDEGTTRLVAPNLTSDVETGAGGGSDDMLARAIREGISHDGRPLHPQMWYPSFSRLSDEDLASVIVYLRSLPAIRNPLPRTQLSEEQVQRIVGRPMPITTPVSGPADDSPLERGRYLAAIGDCGGCHTLWEAERLPGAFAGGNAISRDGKNIYSTNLTPHATGIDYDADAFVQLMRTGKQGLTHPMMPWAAFRHLTDEDLRALHAFLQSRHPVAHAISNLAPPTMCAVCGQAHGLGNINQRVEPKGVAVRRRRCATMSAPTGSNATTGRCASRSRTVACTRSRRTNRPPNWLRWTTPCSPWRAAWGRCASAAVRKARWMRSCRKTSMMSCWPASTPPRLLRDAGCQGALTAVSSSALKRAGSSTCGEWPSSANSTSVAPGIAAAARRPSAG